VARATSATPGYFAPAEIRLNSYLDGGLRYNNPSMEAIREAKRIWGPRKIGCLISIGTGLMNPVSGENRAREQLGFLAGTVINYSVPQSAEKLTVA
jgi:predicted acylesterase/phospholipase RssA